MVFGDISLLSSFDSLEKAPKTPKQIEIDDSSENETNRKNVDKDSKKNTCKRRKQKVVIIEDTTANNKVFEECVDENEDLNPIIDLEQ